MAKNLQSYSMAVATSYAITLQLLKMNGAYTESNSISPETT